MVTMLDYLSATNTAANLNILTIIYKRNDHHDRLTIYQSQ